MSCVIQNSSNLLLRLRLHSLVNLALKLDASSFYQICEFIVEISTLIKIKLLKLFQASYFVKSDCRRCLLVKCYQ